MKVNLFSVSMLFAVLACALVALVGGQSKTEPVGGLKEPDVPEEAYREILDWLLTKDAIAQAQREEEERLAQIAAEEESSDLLFMAAGVIG